MIDNLWEKALEFHGHECPGLAIGVRACEAAILRMNIGFSDDEQIVCVTENDACGVDAIQAILSCTLGKGNLLYRETGKQAFSFFNRKSGERIRVCLADMNRGGMDKSQWQERLLSAPLNEIFTFSEPKYDLPERAKIFATVVCENCGEGAPENKMHLEGGRIVCADCFTFYSRGW